MNTLKKTKPVQLARSGLPRFSWYVLSAPQADVKSALVRSFRVLRIAVNSFKASIETPKAQKPSRGGL
jgi:hypothetical protein